MARQPRFLLAGQVHLVVQQGHNGGPVVLHQEDSRQWLLFLRDAVATHKVVLHAWRLGRDGFSLLVTPPTSQALSRMLQTLGRRYAGWFNARHGRSGTLWGGRFRSCVVEAGPWVLVAMNYVEGAPSTAGPLSETQSGLQSDLHSEPPAQSSLAHHLGQAVDRGLSDVAAYWDLGNTPFERYAAYRGRADTGLASQQIDTIERSLRSGRPIGSVEFITQLEQDAARTLAPRQRGRPRKPGPPSPR